MTKQTPAQVLVSSIGMAMMHAPLLPMTRTGLEPTGYEVEAVDEKTVSVAWTRETRKGKEPKRTGFRVNYSQGEWVHVTGLTGTVKSHREWFPCFIRWASPDEPFDVSKYLNYLRGR